MLRIKLVRSPIGNTARNRATVKALGLRKMHQTVEKEDCPSVQGMVRRVSHLLEIEVVESPIVKAETKARKAAPAASPEVEPAPKPSRPRKKAAADEVKE